MRSAAGQIDAAEVRVERPIAELAAIEAAIAAMRPLVAETAALVESWQR